VALTPAQAALARGLAALIATHGETASFADASFIAVASRRGETLSIGSATRNSEADLTLTTAPDRFTAGIPDNRDEITFYEVAYRVVEVRQSPVWVQLDLKRFE